MKSHNPTQNTSSDCHLSFVVTTRNDNHGGDMLRRFQIFAETLLEQANRYSLAGELVVVEWNPPAGPRLHEVLKLRVKSDCFSIRFIEVPAEAHEAIRNADVIPLFQMIGKNVGIRRARGEFVLATNPDILFSDAVMAFMASDRLLPDVMYRIDRHDVPAEVPDPEAIEKKLAWCDANVLRVHRRRGSFPPPRRFFSKLRVLNPVIWFGTLAALWNLYSSGRLARIARRRWRVLLRYLRTDPLLHFGRFSRRLIKRLVAQFPAFLYSPRLCIRRVLWGALRLTDPLPKVHTNGCGDFTLMSRARWFELRGYPELPLWSMHIDSLLCYMAVACKCQEYTLRSPAKIYHMEHHNSWVVMTPDERLKTFTKKPWIDIGLLSELWENMYRTNRPIRFNTEDWGLADWPLNEIILQSGEKRYLGQSPAVSKGELKWDSMDHQPSALFLSSV